MNLRRISIFLVFLVLFANLTAHTADRQMHFYGDLITGLASDLDSYDSVQYAYGDEMVDGGLYTHPMGLDAARILSHFQGNPITIKTDGGFMKEGLAIATIDHPLLYKLLDEGLKTGNKAMIGAVRHRLIDTFYHAGWSNFWGHMEGGHRPDMPHEEIYKAQRAFQAIMELTFLLRDMSDAPVKTINMENILSKVSGNKLANLYEISGTSSISELAKYMRTKPGIYAQILWDLPELKNAFMIRIENSNQYQDLAFEELFKSMKAAGLIDINKDEYSQIKGFFNDLHDRSDLTSQDAFRLAMFRMYEQLTEVDTEKPDNLVIPEHIKAKLHLEKLIGLTSIEALKAKIDNESLSNAAQLRMLIASIKDFKQSLGGQWIPSSSMSLADNATLNDLAGKVVSWIQIFDPTSGEALSIEDPRAGDIPDLRDVEGFVRFTFNRQPEFLDNFVESLSDKGVDHLIELARLKAIAEQANLAAIQATKDIIPNARNTSLQRVNFENDSLSHACFAHDCRELATRNAIAKLFGVDAKLGFLGTLGFAEYLKKLIKEFKLKMSKKSANAAKTQKARMDSLMREYLVDIGFAQRQADGTIVTEIEMNPELVILRPTMTMKGNLNWMKWSRGELRGIMYRFDIKWKKFRSLEIERRIAFGSEIKDRVVLEMNARYGTGTAVPKEKQLNYPVIKSGKAQIVKNAEFKITGKSNNIVFSNRCEELGIQLLNW